MKLLLLLILFLTIILVAIGIVAVQKNKGKLSQQLFWLSIGLFSVIECLLFLGLLFTLFFGYNS